MITHKELKKLLSYESDTGLFTRLVTASHNAKAGDIAGCVKKCGYRYIVLCGIKYSGHRLAWFYIYGEWPKNIDHINHVRDDNRLCNLREVTHKENTRNGSKRKNNTSGVNGVYWSNTRNKWISEIRADAKKMHLGIFVDKFEAICARKSANNKHGYHHNHGM